MENQSAQKVRLRTMPAMPSPIVYQRADGTCWIKLNAEFQIPVTREKGGQFVGNGMTAEVDPDELVEPVRRCDVTGGGKAVPWSKFGKRKFERSADGQ